MLIRQGVGWSTPVSTFADSALSVDQKAAPHALEVTLHDPEYIPDSFTPEFV